MQFLVSGCSFTGNETSGWPTWLKQFGKVKNLALPGSGNQYIAESVILETSLNCYEYDVVLVMWSGLQRQDYIVDSLVNINDLPVFNNVSYLPAGDLIVDKTFREIVKYGNEVTRGIKSLLEIIKLQNYLQNKKHTYYFMSYVNYWNTEEYVKNRNFGIYRYEILNALAKNLDFSRFIFAENNDCLYELCLKNKALSEDNFHPTSAGNELWMNNFVIPRLKKDKII